MIEKNSREKSPRRRTWLVAGKNWEAAIFMNSSALNDGHRPHYGFQSSKQSNLHTGNWDCCSDAGEKICPNAGIEHAKNYRINEQLE